MCKISFNFFELQLRPSDFYILKMVEMLVSDRELEHRVPSAGLTTVAPSIRGQACQDHQRPPTHFRELSLIL